MSSTLPAQRVLNEDKFILYINETTILVGQEFAQLHVTEFYTCIV